MPFDAPNLLKNNFVEKIFIAHIPFILRACLQPSDCRSVSSRREPIKRRARYSSRSQWPSPSDNRPNIIGGDDTSRTGTTVLDGAAQLRSYIGRLSKSVYYLLVVARSLWWWLWRCVPVRHTFVQLTRHRASGFFNSTSTAAAVAPEKHEKPESIRASIWCPRTVHTILFNLSRIFLTRHILIRWFDKRVCGSFHGVRIDDFSSIEAHRRGKMEGEEFSLCWHNFQVSRANINVCPCEFSIRWKLCVDRIYILFSLPMVFRCTCFHIADHCLSCFNFRKIFRRDFCICSIVVIWSMWHWLAMANYCTRTKSFWRSAAHTFKRCSWPIRASIQ